MRKKVLVVPGEGIGPEVVIPTVDVLESLTNSLEFIIIEKLKADVEKSIKIARESIEKFSDYNQLKSQKFIDASRYISPLFILDKMYLLTRNDEILEALYNACAVAFGDEIRDILSGTHATLFGASLTQDYSLFLFWFRHGMDLFANIRPIKSPKFMNPDNNKIDFVIVRENTEDLYVRYEKMASHDTAIAEKIITKEGSERIAKVAFKLSQERRKKERSSEVFVAHKAKIFKVTDGLFLESCRKISQRFPNISFNDGYIDSVITGILKSPENFDVIVTTNLYGDILTGASAYLIGGMGMVPSASIGKKYIMVEPAHGSAPDIAGKGKANPIATLLSAKMLLEYFKLDEAKILEDGITSTLRSCRTIDLGGSSTTNEFFDQLMKYI